MESSAFIKFEFLGVVLFLTHPVLLTLITLLYVLARRSSRRNRVYLIDFVCYRPPDSLRVPIPSFIEHMQIHKNFQEDVGDFQRKVLERSGLGNETYLPPGLHMIPPKMSLASTLSEMETVLFSTAADLFSKHDIKPECIDILICNCSLVAPVPSVASMVVNRFGLRADIKSFNLSGMGCSAGILSVNLAKNLLKVHPNSTALVLSMESVSSNMYLGDVKSMLLANCLFRMGGAAVLLSNRKQDEGRAKYELRHVITTHLGHRDSSSFNCVMHEQDEQGLAGVSLSRAVPYVAGEALKTNMAVLAPLVLPYSELIFFGLSVVWNRIWPVAASRKGGGGTRIPDFKKAFNHFCIHAGGKAVVEGIGDHLKLRDTDIEASKMTLQRFGNTSSSSTWYAFSYLEAKGVVRNGASVWQVALGSGFKCNSAMTLSIFSQPSSKFHKFVYITTFNFDVSIIIIVVMNA
uniref:3-ketoacyl-CoA synthase n=1 Tax=Kalanchoe fedtschenkoi TaxID=63787 RepID=A0A7N0TG85_KALFE